jgi:uncharacterized damage-inducible protein DinB
MTIAETLLLDFEPEIANTRRVLERIPENNAQWKPHDKSMPIGRLALHVARLPDFGTRILTTEEMDIDREKFPDIRFESTAHLLTELDAKAAEARSHLLSSSDEDLRKHWKLIFKGKAVIDVPRMALYRTMFLNHLVHHRGQLTVYLRLLDVKVPGLYGPSADEQFG